MGSSFILQDGPLSNIENYIDYDGSNIKLKEEFDLSTVIKDDFTIKNKLVILAGSNALGYVDFLCNKGCLNCTNPTCRVPSCEKMGIDEMRFSEGNECIG